MRAAATRTMKFPAHVHLLGDDVPLERQAGAWHIRNTEGVSGAI